MIKKFISKALMPFILAGISFFAQAQTTARTIQDFDSNWKFYLGNADHAKEISYNDAPWRSLNLPHDWSIDRHLILQAQQVMVAVHCEVALAGIGKHLLCRHHQKANIFSLTLMVCI